MIQLDLESLKHVASAVDQLIQRYPTIDILVNNAGLMTPRLEKTENGFQKQIGMNYIGNLRWALKLLPLIKQSDAGRTITLASMMHILGKINVRQFRPY